MTLVSYFESRLSRLLRMRRYARGGKVSDAKLIDRAIFAVYEDLIALGETERALTLVRRYRI